MLVINNNNGVNIIIIIIIIIIICVYIYKRNKECSEDFHTYSHAENWEFSSFNVYFLDIHRNLF